MPRSTAEYGKRRPRYAASQAVSLAANWVVAATIHQITITSTAQINPIVNQPGLILDGQPVRLKSRYHSQCWNAAVANSTAVMNQWTSANRCAGPGSDRV